MPYPPKPAYHAAKTLQQLAGSMDKIRRWDATTSSSSGKVDPSSYVAHMWCNETACRSDSSRPWYVVAVWSRSSPSGGNTVYAPVPQGCYHEVDLFGNDLGGICADTSGHLEVPVSAAPVYFYKDAE